jgi:muconate cycloisomerase
MQIVGLEARLVRIRLRRPVTHASHRRTESDNIIVRCTLSDGSIGTGEGVPRDYVTGETAEQSLALLQAVDRDSLSAACPDFPSAVELAERLRMPVVPGDDRQIVGHAARCALELAVLDAFGRAYGEPLMNVTRLVAPDLYQPQERVQYSGVILTAKPLKLRLVPFMYWLMGFSQVKVKVGVEGYDDVRRLKILRRWLGAKMELRLDANEAWTPSEAIDRIRSLEEFRISSVEQPVPHEQIAELVEVRKHISTPLMLDESLCSEIDAERAIRLGGCDLFNLRLSKCGGFIPTLKLAELAQRHGVGYQLGCQVGETGILSAAGRQFACSVRGIRAHEGSYDRHLVRERLTREDITFGRGGWAPMLPSSGLGVRIDPEQLDEVTVRREVLVG